ncbi:putative tRNA (uracil-O(2)-)-methyltransferase [Armadillidium vulgare]|nr:putative tRNA (uracil-O(2)-)-methyltransferase [Armadillidium vulgare]
MPNGLLKNMQKQNEYVLSESSVVGMEVVEQITSENFLYAVKLYIEKPHVINKKICGVSNIWIGVNREANQDIVLTASGLEKLINIDNSEDIHCENLLQKVLLNYGFSALSVKEGTDFMDVIPWSKNFHQLAVIRKVIPKNIDFEESVYEIILIDIVNDKYVFIPKLSTFAANIIPEFIYWIYLTENKMIIDTLKEIPHHNPGLKWLNKILLPSLVKWSKNILEGRGPSSLCLVNIQNYNRVYQNLKRKYASHLMEIWSESTDPQKFIHEDLAIAAYLIVLWNEERKTKNLTEKQSFLDLGCGNGLLVYILSMEGHPGMGIDIKRRKLWDKFPNTVFLKEDTIIPSDKYLYPEYDWLIGNHSDELTPWLPVISAKSSTTSRYFIIPCCAHDFTSKFQRNKSGISLYSEYLEYIKQIGSICGFENRNYKTEKWKEVIETVDEYVRSRCKNEDAKELSESWCNDFKPREAIQKTRNCTQIDKEVKDKIVSHVTNLLLSQQNFIQIAKDDKIVNWNKGGNCTFKDIINILSKDDLKHLKNECGGLQTLIRNHKFIFQIQNGYINLRVISTKYF